MHQLPNLVDRRRVQACQGAELDIKTPSLDPVKQLLALETQFLRQLMDTRGQRQLLLGGASAHIEPDQPDRSRVIPRLADRSPG
ncbi:hypothetical protein [Singulisphaera sp. GP187]|uniref:hypothetical protein n=1 Tax=Singulisphaera sp. GP187 TaxID=1882752 RepID=UPI00156F90EA|nr:hypothetical protein [Singulisphaera sp. GP187]